MGPSSETPVTVYFIKPRGALIETGIKQQQNEKKKEKKKKKKQHIRFSRENYQHHTIPCKYFMTSDNCVMNIRIIKPGNSLIIGNSHKP